MYQVIHQLNHLVKHTCNLVESYIDNPLRLKTKINNLIKKLKNCKTPRTKIQQ